MILKPIEENKTKLLESEWKNLHDKFGFKWKENEKIIGAFEGEELVGYAKFFTNGGVGYLLDIIVKESHRNKGVGQSLLNYFENFSKKQNCHKLSLKTSENFKPAISFYEKNGYKKEAILKNDKFHTTWFLFFKKI